MIAELLNSINMLSSQQLLAITPAAIFGLACIIFGLLASRWKRKYRSLQRDHLLLEERLRFEQQFRLERENQLEATTAELKMQFRDLAQKIFDEKSRTFSSQNSEKLDILLRPFKEQIDSFRDRVDTIFVEETKERASLRQEILHLRTLNQQINEEARNLYPGNRRQSPDPGGLGRARAGKTA